MGRLNGRVVIITGAARGIGQTYAVAVANEGANVVAVDINDCEETAGMVRAAGTEVLLVHVDVSNEDQVKDMVRVTIERFGRIDCLVNNAAMFDGLTYQPIEDVDLDEWDRLFQVNVKGTFICARAVVPQMREQGYGKIVNMSSSTVLAGATGFPHYVASKGAVFALTRSLSKELGPYGIRVNTIAPGRTDSGALVTMNPNSPPRTGRAARSIDRDEIPEDLTGTLVYLASADSDFVTGQMISVNGGDMLY
jgi:NAD(P)-dependent dehydrogenase (short-subunit alcohol dehydrogenase family)